MPTARELLEQAEALMQRDRAAMMGDGIPTLTDSVPAPDGLGPAIDARRPPTALDDIPLLTETVEDFEPSIPLSQVLDDELALWRETPAGAPASEDVEKPPIDDAPAALAPASEMAPAAALESPPEAEAETPPAATPPESPATTEPQVAAPPSEPQVAPHPIVDDPARWDALAEDIRMQVLQRIDIFTDTGLKDQLNQRL